MPGAAHADVDDLTDLTLAELLDVDVTSVSKRPEKRAVAPAAVYVITAEDLRRSGVTSIPEALRMVPGVSVAKLDANKWSVTSRGFSGRFANKLLVLIDGRSIYTPLFSGVYWETREVLLKDVDRIEVIRGPGGTLWGANAVNGVINIVTKKAADTQGGLVVVGGGTEEKAVGAFRYGGRSGEHGHYRVYGQLRARDEGEFADGEDGQDDWVTGRGGVRFDWEWPDGDLFTLQGDTYGTDVSQSYELAYLRPPFTRFRKHGSYFSGGNLLGRWTHRFSDQSDLQVQAYYDRSESNIITVDEDRDTFDLDLQHRLELGARHELVWGLGFRYLQDKTSGSPFVSLDPEDRRQRLFSAFVQDSITLPGDKLRLTIGSKIEHNDFTGVEIQPSARLVWTPAEGHSVWAAVSRAVRTPSRIEDDGRIRSMALPRTEIALFGNRDFKSEDLLAFELGYRLYATERFALDLAAFYNVYDDLRSIEIRAPFIQLAPLPLRAVVPAVGHNNMSAETYGFEVALDGKPRPWWQLRLAYTFTEVDIDLHPKTIDIVSGQTEEDAPEQQVYLRNSFDLSNNLELDVVLRYVDPLPSLGVDDYVTADLRLGWHPSENLEVSIAGRNLLDSEHTEFASTFVDTVPTEVERGIYGEISWRF